MENLTLNITSPWVEKPFNTGKYLTAKATIIVSGVLNGSRGPLYYPQKEISDSREAWEGIPILLNHPSNGKSGKDEDVLSNSQLGYIANPEYADGKLQAELRFDVERTKDIANTVYEDLVNNQKIELSTGLGTSNEPAEEGAVFNSPVDGPKPYTQIARNYRPDHLAILPDQVGACSIRDGCGVNNKLAESDVRSAIQRLLKERYPTSNNVWVEELFTNEVIYFVDERLFRLKYTKARDKVTLSDDEPREVQRVTSYKLITNLLDGPEGSSSITSLEGDEPMAKKLTDKQKETIINELITNSCCWEEEDREELVAMTENQLTKTKQAADKQTENEELLTAAEQGFNDDRDSVTFNQEKKAWERVTKPEKKDPEPVANEQKKLTEEEFMAMAPDSVRNTLAHAASVEQTEKKHLIERITVNVSDDAKPDAVANFGSKTIEELQQIASLMPASTVPGGNRQDYYGGQPQADVSVANEEMDQEDLLIPEDIDYTANSAFAE